MSRRTLKDPFRESNKFSTFLKPKVEMFCVCSKELTADARELKGELYCLPCHDKLGVPICGACRRPIEGRVVNAMGKQWHVEVFHYNVSLKKYLGYTSIFKQLIISDSLNSKAFAFIL